jgi:hypothetical protein
MMLSRRSGWARRGGQSPPYAVLSGEVDVSELDIDVGDVAA